MATPRKTKILMGADRAKFIRLSKACSNPAQLARITARLTLNKFVIEQGQEVCQATFDDIMKKRKKR